MIRLQKECVDFLEGESLSLQHQLFTERSTGRTYRLANEIIDKFFSLPKGSVIPVVDHYPSKAADINLLKLVVRRLEHDFPGVEYKIDKVNNTIMRISSTPREKILEELTRIRATK